MTDIRQIIRDLTDGDFYTIKDIAKITHTSTEFIRGVLNDPSIQFSENLDGSGCIYIMDIKYDTIVDGDGFRNSVYCAGCNVFCSGCHNPQSWFITNGRPVSINELFEILSSSPYDVTFTGGEASVQAKTVAFLAQRLKKECGKNIWLYSGHVFEELIDRNSDTHNLLNSIDVLVDGKFLEKFKKPDLIFRGSENQRIIDVQKSISEDRIVLYGFNK